MNSDEINLYKQFSAFSYKGDAESFRITKKDDSNAPFPTKKYWLCLPYDRTLPVKWNLARIGLPPFSNEGTLAVQLKINFCYESLIVIMFKMNLQKKAKDP